MPGRNPFLIAKEYLQVNESPQVRKNALTALAALGDPQSRAVLAEAATTEDVAEVRSRAQAEIASMPAGDAQQVVDLVLEGLSVPERQRGVYALLSELRNRGMSFDFPHLPLITRLKLAKALRDYLNPRRAVKFHFRTIAGVLAGTFLAWLAVFALWIGPFHIHLDFWMAVFYLILGWLLTMALAMAATLFTSPARLYADVAGGALLDMGMGALSALGFSAGAILISVANRGPHPLLLLLIAPLSAVAVRAGTLAVFGLAKAKGLNRLIQTVVGGSCGLAIFELALMIANKTEDDFFAVSWLMILLCCYGLAAAYAWIDSGSRSLPVAPKVARVAALALASVTLLLAGVQLIPLPAATVPLGSLAASTIKPIAPIDLRQVPATISFKPATDSDLTLTLDPDGMQNYAAFLTSSDGKANQKPFRVGEYYYTVRQPQQQLKAGEQYDILVENNPNDRTVFDVAPFVMKQLSWPQIKARITRRQPVSGPVLATITLKLDNATHDVTIDAGPSWLNIAPGQMLNVNVRISPVAGFDKTVSLSCSTPLGWLCSPPISGSVALNGTSSNTSTVGVLAPASAQKGIYAVTFAATRGVGPPSANNDAIAQSKTIFVVVK